MTSGLCFFNKNVLFIEELHAIFLEVLERMATAASMPPQKNVSEMAMMQIIDFLGLNVNTLVITHCITLFLLVSLSLYYEIPRKIILEIVSPKYGKSRFLRIINPKGTLLDVGCGNNSPYRIKSAYLDIVYTGIDVGDYNQTKPNLADKYIIAEPDKFAETIANIPERFDTVISSHNLEHCNDREKTLDAMIKVMKSGGYLYLSFPTEKSVNFPPRKGTLNYYDDPTHKDTPPDYDKIMATLRQNDMDIIFANKSYKPFFLWLIGFLLEWKSRKDKEVKIWNWAYWGFESIIWAKKK